MQGLFRARLFEVVRSERPTNIQLARMRSGIEDTRVSRLRALLSCHLHRILSFSAKITAESASERERERERASWLRVSSFARSLASAHLAAELGAVSGSELSHRASFVWLVAIAFVQRRRRLVASQRQLRRNDRNNRVEITLRASEGAQNSPTSGRKLRNFRSPLRKSAATDSVVFFASTRRLQTTTTRLIVAIFVALLLEGSSLVQRLRLDSAL